MRDERAPSLDVRDVEDEDCRRQHGGHPDESGIGGLVHGESCTNKSCAKPLTVFLIPQLRPKVINSFCEKSDRERSAKSARLSWRCRS